jgi:hypothetical protein
VAQRHGSSEDDATCHGGRIRHHPRIVNHAVARPVGPFYLGFRE